MKKLSALFILILVLSCQKNEPPICTIIQPSENDTLTIGENIPVSVDADDSDGFVSEVRLYLNNIGIASSDSFPYNFELNTDEFEAGNYTIKATAIDNEGLDASDEVQISIDADMPSVTTSEVSAINDSVYCGGNVLSDRGAEVSARGVCWSNSQNPSLSDSITIDGSGTGSFTSSISGLMCGTTYYIRAYATNSEGTSYGDQVIFTTDSCLGIPTVMTSVISDTAETAAQGGGIVTDDGGATVTARGICWSVTTDPTIIDDHTTDGSGTGSFTSSISGLICGTTYYIRAYATNSEGISYGDQVIITTDPCLGIPTVMTSVISDITETAAQGGGDVTDDGGTAVTERGVCWSVSSNPTISDDHTINGSGTGCFTSTISGLLCGTKYYVRAYATNSEGTSYGDQVDFTTDPCLSIPSVVTSAISNITGTAAQGGGVVTDEGGTTVTARGVCWSVSSNPTISDDHTTDGSGSGSYSSELSGLSCNTTYYVRAYATNSNGIAYGGEESFSTDFCSTLIDYDGNIYQSIRIGDQIWMVQNLKVTHYADGTPIPNVESDTSWNTMSATDKAYCWYNNNIAVGNTYGALYNWAAAMNGHASSETNPSNIQGVCPTGWHLPSHDEWKQLEIFLGMSQVDADNPGWRGTDEGGKLKATGTDYWYPPNTGATNSSGFTSIPSGYRLINGPFLNLFIYAIYWSATEGLSTHAWYRHLMNDKQTSGSNYYDKRAGLSVRCVKD